MPKVDEEWLDNPSTRRLMDELTKERAGALLALKSAARHSQDANVKCEIVRIDQIDKVMMHITGRIITAE